jgi:hypothetical protein
MACFGTDHQAEMLGGHFISDSRKTAVYGAFSPHDGRCTSDGLAAVLCLFLRHYGLCRRLAG